MNGELVGIVDSDDYLAPDMYEKLYDLMINYDADMSICDCYSVYNGEKTKGKDTDRTLDIISGEQALIAITKPGYIYSSGALWAKLYKSELFKNVRFPVGNKHQDTATIHRLYGQCQQIAVSYEPLYYYRIREGSAMTTIYSKTFNIKANIKYWHDHRDAFKDLYEYLESLGMHDLAKFARLRSYNYSVMAEMLMRLNYFQYRKDIINFMGCTPLKLSFELLFSGEWELAKRGVKLMLLWVKSMFNPKLEYVPLTADTPPAVTA